MHIDAAMDPEHCGHCGRAECNWCGGAVVYRCVVGNCTQSDERVERCYWNYHEYVTKDELRVRAYLDLCWFHREFMNSHERLVYVQGWDSSVQ